MKVTLHVQIALAEILALGDGGKVGRGFENGRSGDGEVEKTSQPCRKGAFIISAYRPAARNKTSLEQPVHINAPQRPLIFMKIMNVHDIANRWPGRPASLDSITNGSLGLYIRNRSFAPME